MKASKAPAGARRLPKYKVEIHWSEEDKCYVARVPELPGCVTDGETYAKAAANAEEAVESYLDALANEGKAAPVPMAEREYSGKIPLRIKPVVHRDAALRAELAGISLNRYIEQQLQAPQATASRAHVRTPNQGLIAESRKLAEATKQVGASAAKKKA